MVKISGRLVEPADDKPRSGVTLTLHSVKNSSVVLKHATYRCVTGGNGEYSFNAAPGTYAVAVSVYGAEPERVGQIRVYSDSLPGNLNTFLMAPAEDDLTPEIIRLVDSMRSEAVKAAESAKNSEQIVTQSASEVANNTASVQRNTEQVAQNTQTVGTKAQQVAENTNSVSANTLSVTQMRDEVAAKTSMAQGAADTATQKAASAAGHDAAAAEYARQAQEAAQATAGALIDGGAVNLSGGIYPQPVMVGSTKRPTFWKVTTGGVVGGVDYGVGDTLIYTTSDGGSYYKIDNTESVTSVQGEKGAVTLTPEKIGADPAGSAAACIKQHESKSAAHTPESVGATPMGKIKFAGSTSGLDWNALGDGYVTPGGQKSGLLAFQYDDGNRTGPNSPFGDAVSSGYGIAVCLSANLFSLQSVFCDSGDIAFRTSYNGQPLTWTRIYGSKNTTVDSNGFIKRASPIARLYGNETSAKRDSEYVVSGCAAVNHEAEGVYAVREAVGLYRVTGSLGFATDGWYIETPADTNGNKLLFVEYEQCSNGDIFIKTFTPDYSSGRCAAGEPKDIPDGRWIDLRLSMPEIAEL